MLIGEVAQRSGVSSRMLRHYESLGLVRPEVRTSSGYREYSDADIRRVFQVEALRSLGLSLRDVARALDDPSFAPGALVADLIEGTERRIARDRELLDRLRLIRSGGPGDWDDVLGIVRLLRGLGSEHPALRQRAALSAADGPTSPESLARAVLSEPDENIAGALRWALARTGTGGLPEGSEQSVQAVPAVPVPPPELPAPPPAAVMAALAVLADGVQDADPVVRVRAVLALAEFPSEQANAMIRALLTDPAADVRRSATLAIGRRGDPAATAGLVELIATGTDDVEAAELLGRMLDRQPAGELAERVIGQLVDRLSGSGSDATQRMRLAQALAELPVETARTALTELTDDDERTVALTARSILERQR